MKRTFLLLILAPLLLWSCSKDDEAMPGTPQAGEQIKFEISFATEDNGKLRVATGSDFKSTWEAGDEIGVFAAKNGESLVASGNSIHNVKLIRQNDSSWKGDIYWPNDVNKNKNLDFYAYYPYDAAMTAPTAYTFSVLADQSDDNYNKSDLLLAKALNQNKGSTVNLQFSHALSLVQVQVEREVNVPHFDDDFTVTLTNVLSGATLNWSGNLTGTGTATDIVMHKVEGMDYTYRALVPAQTLGADTRVTFVQSTTGKEIDMEYQGVKSVSLASKSAHKYSVTLGWGIDPGHEYAVGDKYPHVGPAIGIVYYITDGGKHGKVVSLDEAQASWNAWAGDNGATNLTNGLNNMKAIKDFIASSNPWPPFGAYDWVHAKNAASEDYSNPNATGVWYLPAKDELSSLYSVYNAYGKPDFNNKLTSAGGTALSDSRYWSSSENEDYDALIVDFYDGNARPAIKDANNRVRCVLAF